MSCFGQASFKNFQEAMKKGEPFVGEDDGGGWIWAVADLTVEGGMTLELRRATPLGMRALMVAKQGRVPEMFDALSWSVVRPSPTKCSCDGLLLKILDVSLHAIAGGG